MDRKRAPQARRLGFESLENREYLVVTPLLYADQIAQTAQVDWFEQRNIEQPPQPGIDGIVAGSAVENEWLIQLNERGLERMPSVSAAAEYLQPHGITVVGGLGLEGMLHVRRGTIDCKFCLNHIQMTHSLPV